MESEYSVLMSVYARENPRFLQQALKSISTQTVPASEVILVKDGPLTSALESVLEDAQAQWGLRLTICPIERNVGLGSALGIGLKACTCPIVARMDADDISDSSRCEKQLNFLDTHPEVCVVGTWISEFEDDEGTVYARRILPTSHDEIQRFAAKRNPLNHMTVMFRKESVEAVGGYRPFSGFEDYDLWVRMLVAGARFANIPECLVKARGGQSQLRRRGGVAYAISEVKFQREMLALGFIDIPQFADNVLIRLATRLAPLALRERIYRSIRRPPHGSL